VLAGHTKFFGNIVDRQEATDRRAEPVIRHVFVAAPLLGSRCLVGQVDVAGGARGHGRRRLTCRMAREEADKRAWRAPDFRQLVGASRFQARSKPWRLRPGKLRDASSRYHALGCSLGFLARDRSQSAQSRSALAVESLAVCLPNQKFRNG
jgi:hypothetical protein